ncbi:unnamed protein product [Polarella glacialis]|uniref:Uncharacterized protein n=1 Tax=Polarella glacialis TaxID=89957 RepID=A0A813IPM7_POLGL|nr:unnamed protein product [Polarella glacialis]
MAAAVVGWYDLSWSGGSFPICFRPAGNFFCAKFQAPGRWTMEGDLIKIDWAKFGKYEMKFDAATKTMEGNAMPLKTDDEKNWRKAAFSSALSPTEVLLIGDGGGSEWEFEWSGGSFPVKFKADGYNHFQCDDFPAHAHWSLDGDLLKINWSQFGNYELKVAADGTMDGGAVGKPEDWRKAKFTRNMIVNGVVESCEHH